MNNDLDLLRELYREAKHSYMIAFSITGDTLSPLFMKWADIAWCLIEYIDDCSKIKQVVEDISILICMPVKIVATSFIEKMADKHDISHLIDKVNHPDMDIRYCDKDPIRIKNDFISIINDLIDIGEFKYSKIVPIDAGGKNVVRSN